MIYNRKMLLVLLLASTIPAIGQKALDPKLFFTDTSVFPATFSTDIANLTSGKIHDNKQPGRFTGFFDDSAKLTGNVIVNTRGNMRKSICFIPPLRIQFAKDSASQWAPLKSLKLVCACQPNPVYEQLLVREYLLYKMYNLLTDISFKARMVQVTFEDVKGKKKPIVQLAFFLEDVDQLAKRNKCISVENNRVLTDATDNDMIALTAIFEYMIGNTDWSVPNAHNIKLIRSKQDSLAKPYAIPYDFDYAGIVNPPYAVPSPDLGIELVTERIYRGFPRTMNQLEPIIKLFQEKKAEIYGVINNCPQLKAYGKKDMTNFLDDFFKIIDKPSSVKTEFIDRARTQ